MRVSIIVVFGLLIACCCASGLEPLQWDSSSSDSDDNGQGESSASRDIRNSALWSSKQSLRTSLANFRREAALEEVGGLRKLINEDRILSLRSPNFVIWLQHNGREAFSEERGYAARLLEKQLKDRVRWMDFEDQRGPLTKQYDAALRDDKLHHEGYPTYKTILLKARIRLISHAGYAPTRHEAQIFELTNDQAETALKLVDKFERYAQNAVSRNVRPRAR